MDAPAYAVLAPLDRARRHVLALVARVNRALVARREPRVAVAGALPIALGFTLTAAAPLTLLLVGPILLGVPHVMSDVRYLVARPGLYRRWPVVVFVGAPLLVAAAGGGVRAGLVAAFAAFLVARGRPWVRALGAIAAALLFALAWWAGTLADLAFAHLHNFVAVFAWWSWRERRGRLHWLPLAAFLLGAGLLLLGAFTPDISNFPWATGEGLVPLELSMLGGRLVALYAFAQAAHYTVWLRLIPEEDREQPTPRTFAASFSALRRDLGPWLMGLAGAAALFFAGFAFFDLAKARDTYLSFAIFHGHLELAALAILFVERRLPVSVASTR